MYIKMIDCRDNDMTKCTISFLLGWLDKWLYVATNKRTNGQTLQRINIPTVVCTNVPTAVCTCASMVSQTINQLHV